MTKAIRFENKEAAINWLNANFFEYAETEVFNVHMVGPTIAKFMKIEPGYYIGNASGYINENGDIVIER